MEHLPTSSVGAGKKPPCYVEGNKADLVRCFYINVPIGFVSTVLIVPFLKVQKPKSEKLPLGKLLMSFDVIGTSLLLPSIVCIQVALEWGGVKYAWSDWHIIALLVSFSVGFTASNIMVMG